MARECALEAFLHRNDEDSVPLGDITVRQFLFMMKQDLAELFPDPLFRMLPLPPQVP